MTNTRDALATLGTILDEIAGRDAVHIAVEPVVAGQSLVPGTHVDPTDPPQQGLKPGDRGSVLAGDGPVDPTDPPQQGLKPRVTR